MEFVCRNKRKTKMFRYCWPFRVSLRQFQKGAAPCLPFHRMNSALFALHSKIALFLPFRKKREKECLFMMIIYILNMSYTFKLKSAFGNRKCALKNIKSALFLFSARCPFFLAWGKLWNTNLLITHFQLYPKFCTHLFS